MALQANIWFADPGAVAVLVAAALSGAVLPHKAKVTLANARGHARPVHAALRAHRLALARDTADKQTGRILVKTDPVALQRGVRTMPPAPTC